MWRIEGGGQPGRGRGPGSRCDGGGLRPGQGGPTGKVAKDLRNILSNLKGMKDANVQGSLVAIDLQKKLQAAEDEIRQSKPAHVRLLMAMRQRDALAA